MTSKLSWWRKDGYGWPIETFKGRPVLSFTRIICQNVKKLFWWRFRPWRNFKLPVVNQVFPPFVASELISVQPMSNPISQVFYLDVLDDKNPKMGQIFTLGEKVPHNHEDRVCRCCLRGPCWHKIWTPKGWVFEKDNEEFYNTMVLEFNVPYLKETQKQHEEMCKKGAEESNRASKNGMSCGVGQI